MPLFYLRRLTGSRRTEIANRHLARYLAFIAGATNAGGLLAVGQYTSHMSGIVSAMARQPGHRKGPSRPCWAWCSAVFSYRGDPDDADGAMGASLSS